VALTDNAIEAIRRMITSGEVSPGDRLPRESELAERLGLSRNSLREAVKALEMINVLTVRQGDGTYVASLDPGTLVDTMGFVLDFQPPEAVLHFLQVRRMLEPAATAIAAVVMSDEEIGALGRLLDELPAEPDIDDLVASDAAFHGRIAAASGNPVLCSLLETLSTRTQKARTWRGITQRDAVGRTLREHREIQQAMLRRDPESARAWATVHIAGVEDWIASTVPHPGS
jgi:GntR family transcriptional repressor for pyruvate dehydrogenase complex